MTDEYADPSAFDTTRRPIRLLEFAEEHLRLFGEEEFDLEEWGVDTSDPVELAEILEELEELKRWIRLIEAEAKRLLGGYLGDGAIRVVDSVYLVGPGSGTWKPTSLLWRWLVDRLADDPAELARALESLVSGVRVTAVDGLAKDVDKQTIRDTFLEYRPGKPGVQRKDLRVEAVAKSAPRWWPKRHGEMSRRAVPKRDEETEE